MNHMMYAIYCQFINENPENILFKTSSKKKWPRTKWKLPHCLSVGSRYEVSALVCLFACLRLSVCVGTCMYLCMYVAFPALAVGPVPPSCPAPRKEAIIPWLEVHPFEPPPGSSPWDPPNAFCKRMVSRHLWTFPVGIRPRDPPQRPTHRHPSGILLRCY